MSAIGSTGGAAPHLDPAAATDGASGAGGAGGGSTSAGGGAGAAPLGHAAFAAEPGFAEVAAGRRSLEVGERGAHVRVLAETLAGLGYASGGRAGEQLTRAVQSALARFQRDHGLTTSGALDRATLLVLDARAREQLGAGTPAAPSLSGRPQPPAAPLADRGIARALERAIADRVLDADEVAALFDAAGGSVSDAELQDIRAAVLGAAAPSGGAAYQVTAEARAKAVALATERGLDPTEAADTLDGVSFGGAPIPDAVREVVAAARLAGAVAYDVNETRTNAQGEVEGVYTPYPSVTEPTANMTFDFTEVTPEKLAADLADTEVVYKAIVGTETRRETDPATGAVEEHTAVVYEERRGGTGNVTAHYDEAWHDDIYARGGAGQKWASNFAILSDGSIHALPASRRSEDQDLILTNPALARGKGMLFNGHLEIRGGVVTGVEMSGRLAKRAARGQDVFVDPIAILQAWGFRIAPDVRIQYGNASDGLPVVDPETHTIRAPR